MEAVESPSGDPEQNVLLAFKRINIGKENADQQRGHKKAESDNGLSDQEKWIRRPMRTIVPGVSA